jgi:excisionase family DNA binding protein
VEQMGTEAIRAGLLGNGQAANYLGVSENTLPRWRWQGFGPRFIKVGRKVLYRVEDLEDFLKGRTVDPGRSA